MRVGMEYIEEGTSTVYQAIEHQFCWWIQSSNTNIFKPTVGNRLNCCVYNIKGFIFHKTLIAQCHFIGTVLGQYLDGPGACWRHADADLSSSDIFRVPDACVVAIIHISATRRVLVSVSSSWKIIFDSGLIGVWKYQSWYHFSEYPIQAVIRNFWTIGSN